MSKTMKMLTLLNIKKEMKPSSGRIAIEKKRLMN